MAEPQKSWADVLLEKASAELRAAKVRDEIEAVREQSDEAPHISVHERLRELRREHFELTGTGGN